MDKLDGRQLPPNSRLSTMPARQPALRHPRVARPARL